MNIAVDIIKNVEKSGGKFFVANGNLIVDIPNYLIEDGTIDSLKITKRDILKLLELRSLIQTVGRYYHATENEIAEMFDDTLKHHSLEVALMTFHNVVLKIQSDSF